MVPYTKELGDKMKHTLNLTGRKYVFSIKDLMPDDAGLYQVDVEGVNVFSTEFKSTRTRASENRVFTTNQSISINIVSLIA